MERAEGDDSVRARLAAEDGPVTVDDEERPRANDSGKSSQKAWVVTIKKILRTIYRAVSSVVGLLVLLVVYSFIGAAIFHVIEGGYEATQKDNITLTRGLVIDSVKELSTNLSRGIINQTQHDAYLNQLLYNYEEAVHIASTSGISNSTSPSKWNFWGSMFFCGTIYTTIGYGHITPSTDTGRIMTMIYAAVGIPLALICLADLGKHFTLGLKIAWAFFRRYGPCRASRFNHVYEVSALEKVENADDPETSDGKPGDMVYFGYKIDDQFNISIYLAISILLVYIFLGAMMYSLWEEWSYLEAFYFVFISVSTIGFGDVLPAHTKFFLLSSVYVFFGLSLVSMCVNIAIEFFSETIDKAKVNIDKAKVKAKEKAKEAKVVIDEVSIKTIDRAKDLAKEAQDKVKKSLASQDKGATSSDEVGPSRPVTEIPETNQESAK